MASDGPVNVAQGVPATQQEMGSLRAQVESLQAQIKSAQEALAAAKSEVPASPTYAHRWLAPPASDSMTDSEHATL